LYPHNGNREKKPKMLKIVLTVCGLLAAQSLSAQVPDAPYDPMGEAIHTWQANGKPAATCETPDATADIRRLVPSESDSDWSVLRGCMAASNGIAYSLNLKGRGVLIFWESTGLNVMGSQPIRVVLTGKLDKKQVVCEAGAPPTEISKWRLGDVFYIEGSVDYDSSPPRWNHVTHCTLRDVSQFFSWPNSAWDRRCGGTHSVAMDKYCKESGK
jgi:hypothetical protein